MSNERIEVPVYTPVIKNTGVRITIQNPIYEEGFSHGRGLGVKGIICDPQTGKRYLITGKACDFENCQCDAWGEEIAAFIS